MGQTTLSDSVIRHGKGAIEGLVGSLGSRPAPGRIANIHRVNLVTETRGNVGWIDEGNDYPRLWWELPPEE